ncbi:helix-turn-helix domain-containing protein [Streptomyces profundus]|uniref:helix-turn-helix domain-containing protein n=1 Tax=Streptomyces profundus TaxID=2867410 RepID=UPI001D16E05F|nr:LysR family transcriptional regulator [Streptomyces sp. MA3_2.13]UED86398.1 hypothetical protein K4G22_21220 [Streptomyces sp. MA3_2.13]
MCDRRWAGAVATAPRDDAVNTALRKATLTAFPRDADLDPGTVTLRIRKLEQDLDDQLLVRGAVKHAMQLTCLDKKAVAATQLYADQLGDLHGPPPNHRTD